jgi:hypothetical protein
VRSLPRRQSIAAHALYVDLPGTPRSAPAAKPSMGQAQSENDLRLTEDRLDLSCAVAATVRYSTLTTGGQMALALRCFPMARLLARSVALIAIYAIALQALLLGYLQAAHVGLDPVAVICAGDSSDRHDRPLSPHNGDCDRCLLGCHAISPALIPPGSDFFLARLGLLAASSFLWVKAIPPLPRHRPQVPRGPPTSA